jgi:Domain of unknown function (DUF4148)
MNRKLWILIATTGVALFGAASAFAQEATQDFNDMQSLSTVSRDEVRNELRAAQHEGSVEFHEASPAPEADATALTRTQVKAATLEARRLGQLGWNEAGEMGNIH